MESFGTNAKVAESSSTTKESRLVMVPTPDGDVYVEHARWVSVGARPAECALEFLANVLTNSDESSGTFNFAALRRPQKSRPRADFDRRNPGVLHPADGFWWSLARLQGLPLERGPPRLVVRGQGRLVYPGGGRRYPSWAGVDEDPSLL